MNVSRTVGFSLVILGEHKLRTALSLLGLIVGVAAVIVVSAIGKGAEARVLASIRNMGSNLLIVNAGQTKVVAGRQRQIDTVHTLIPADAAAIAGECAESASACPLVTRKLAVQWEDALSNTTVGGIAPEGFAVRNIEIARGRYFSPEEDRAKRRVAVLGSTVATNVFGSVDPLGMTFRIGKVPFEVIGVMKAKGTDANGIDQDDQVLVPLRTAMRRLMNVDHVNTIYVQARSADEVGALETEIRNLLRTRHHLGNRPDDFTVQNQVALLQAEREASQAMTLLIGSVAGVSLLVGGVGILAVMLMSVRERAGEIGLRRAVGALRRDIRDQFLLESGALACAGGSLGVVAGLAVTAVVSVLGNWPMIVSWTTVLTAFAFSVALGVGFGVYPAMRAARLEPIEALRSE